MKKRHSIGSFFTFLLLLTFTLFSLLLVSMGSSIYQRGTEYFNENFTSRTAIAYITEKARHNDTENAVSFTLIDETPAISFLGEENNTAFITYIYYYDGYLCELVTKQDTVPSLQAGTHLIPLDSFTIDPTSVSSVLSVTAVSNQNHSASALIHLYHL